MYRNLAKRVLSLKKNLGSSNLVKMKFSIYANNAFWNKQRLPCLPVPHLNVTMDKFLKSCKILVDDCEYGRALRLVQEFIDGEGKVLQSLLVNRYAQRANWLEDWWLDTAYLSFRKPVVVYSSPGLVLPIHRFYGQDDYLEFAARLILGCIEYKRQIDCDEIPVDKMGNIPLDMQQYKKIFGTCRVPGLRKDTLSYNSNTFHIIVCHKNHFYRLELRGCDCVYLNEQQLIEQLAHIMKTSYLLSGDHIGIFTSEHRDTWGCIYCQLIQHPHNAESMKAIETSMFVLCLDEPCGFWHSPGKERKQTMQAYQTILGNGPLNNGANRWYDKTLQIIVGKDGVLGMCYEHSPAEGQPIAVLADFLMDFVRDPFQHTKDGSSSPITPWRLLFSIPDDMKGLMWTAQDNLTALTNELELNCFTYEKYGKDFIKKHKFSPDSYIQMAIQLAFYRLHIVPGVQYESASTRMYYGGRTETIRSCSEESLYFAQMMMCKCCPDERIEALKTAINCHKKYATEAVHGHGVDRHLLGLRMIAKENGWKDPKLFSDPCFTRSSYFRLSTSQVALESDGFMVYGPLVPDGYATCYNPQGHDINFGTSAFASNPDTNLKSYKKALIDALDDMFYLLDDGPHKSKL